MAPLSGEWLEALKGEFHQPYYTKLYKGISDTQDLSSGR